MEKEKFSEWIKRKPILNAINNGTWMYVLLTILLLAKMYIFYLLDMKVLCKSFYEVGFPVAFVVSFYHSFRKL